MTTERITMSDNEFIIVDEENKETDSDRRAMM